MFPCDDLRKIFTEKSGMAKVPKGIETLPKILIACWVGRMNVTDDWQTTDERAMTATVNVSSLKSKNLDFFTKSLRFLGF